MQQRTFVTWGPQTFAAPVLLGADQTWTMFSSSDNASMNFNGGINTNGGSGNAPRALTFHIAAPTSFLNGNISGGGALIKNFASGTLVLNGANTYTGGTTISGGTLQLDHAGSIGSTGTIDLAGGTLRHSAANNTDYSPRFSHAPGRHYSIDTNGRNVAFAAALTSSGGRLTKHGAGTLLLTKANTYTGSTVVNGGSLVVSGGSLMGEVIVGAGGNLSIQNNATLDLQADTETLFVSGAPGNPATVNMTSGTLRTRGGTIGGEGDATFTQSGGDFSTGTLGLILGKSNGGNATYSLSGGTLTTNRTFLADYPTVCTFDQTGGTHTTNTLSMASASAATATYHLSGGTLSAGTIFGGDGTTTFNFNGGTLRANASSVTFFHDVDTVNVRAGVGARIDTNGFDVTASQPLRHDTTPGAPAIDGGLTKLGAGSLTLTGGGHTYTGPTAVTAGELRIANDFDFNSPVSLAAGTTLTLDIAADVRLLKGVTGPGAINVAGSGRTGRLAGDDSGFTGTFSLPAGTRGMMWSNAAAGSAAATWDLAGEFALIETGAGASTVRLGALRGANAATQLAAFGGSGVKTFEVGALGTDTTFAGSIRNISTFGGGGTGTVALTKVGTGTLTLAGANTYTGTTTVTGGTLVLAHANAINAGQALTVGAGATARVQTGVATAVDIGALSVNAAGKLDLNDGALVKRNGGGTGSGAAGQTATRAITALLKAGLENGGNFDWLGNGIRSAEAKADNAAAGSMLYGLGVVQNNLDAAGSTDGTTTDATAGNTIYTSFKGRTVALNDTLVRYTYMGDADLDGAITGTDYSLIDAGFGASLSGWLNGDFDYSGAIDGTDYALIDNAFGVQAGVQPEEVHRMISQHAALFGQTYVDALMAVQSGIVPEPGGLMFFAAAAGVCVRRRRGRA